MTRTAEENDTSYGEQVREKLEIYEQNKLFLHQMFLDYGEEAYRATCNAYPEYTESEKTDFPNYYKEHIQIFENYWHKQ